MESKVLGYIQWAVWVTFKNAGVTLRRESGVGMFSPRVWMSLWLEPTAGLIAMKPCPIIYREAINDENGIMPMPIDVELMQCNDSFCVYTWPELKRVGMMPIEEWRKKCPHAMPVHDVRHWTRLWYKQQFGFF